MHLPITEPNVAAGDGPRAPAVGRPLLSVIVPVFNQAASIVASLEVIRERVGAELGEDFEIVVVSDGSIDSTEDELVARAPAGAFRVFHYDRNLGKGYAVRLGALEASGEWVGFVDADLDLDPADLAVYMRHARERGLDFAIGSKRHPDSQVHYPRSRIIASWMFQQLVRLLFRLNVRDTQVGLKVFSRDVAEQVLPLLLVKRYAFDIELLAVGRAFGFARVEELPVRLDYRFTGSGVRSRAVVRALVDTAAIFYRLRILHYYQRRRALAGAYGWSRPRSELLRVSVLLLGDASFRTREHPDAEFIQVADVTARDIRAAAERAAGDVLAILEPGASAAANWLTATVPYFARPEIAAVVVPKMAPLAGPARLRAAAAIDESRIGAGFGYFRYTPGNVRYVADFPAATIAVRRDDFLSLAPDVELRDVVASLTAEGGRVLYTPDSVIVSMPPALFMPHLRAVFDRGRSFGRAARHGRVLHRGALLFTLGLALVVVITAIARGGAPGDAGIAALGVYLLAVLGAAVAAGLRHQSLRVAVLVAVGIVATHAVVLTGAVRGISHS